MLAHDKSEGFAQIQLMRKISWRLLPALTVMFAFAQLARFNVSFASTTMNQDLGFSESVYGLGAGLFFVGYLSLQVPINSLVPRIGAPRIFLALMVSWGLLSSITALVSTPVEFYVVRFLVGAAESGLYAAIVLYLTYWFPVERRATAMAIVALSLPLAGLLGAPISMAIIDSLDGYGNFAGWQWMFILEGLPVVALAPAMFFFLTSVPDRARWLSFEQRASLRLALADSSTHINSDKANLRNAFQEKAVWRMTAMYALLAGGASGGMFWLPKAVTASMSLESTRTIGLLLGVPYIAFAIGGILWGRSADRKGERRWHTFWGTILCGAGLALVGFADGIMQIGVALILFNIGFAGSFSVAWSMVTETIPKQYLAVGIAIVSSAGAVGAFLGIYLFGVLLDATGSFAVGLCALGALICGGGWFGLYRVNGSQ